MKVFVVYRMACSDCERGGGDVLGATADEAAAEEVVDAWRAHLNNPRSSYCEDGYVGYEAMTLGTLPRPPEIEPEEEDESWLQDIKVLPVEQIDFDRLRQNDFSAALTPESIALIQRRIRGERS